MDQVEQERLVLGEGCPAGLFQRRPVQAGYQPLQVTRAGLLRRQALRQVTSNPDPGQFVTNSSRRGVLANNPAGHTVEVTQRERWVTGSSNNVTVEGFATKHSANDRSGAVLNNGHANWTVLGNGLSRAHATNVSLSASRDLELVGNNIRHAGQMGASYKDAIDILVQNNRTHHNTEDFDPGWAAGA